jgi:hypothetical protein
MPAADAHSRCRRRENDGLGTNAKRVSGKRGDAQDVEPAGVGVQLNAGKIRVDERSHVGCVEQTPAVRRTEIRFRTVAGNGR